MKNIKDYDLEDLKKELKDQCSEYQKLQAKANEAMSEYNVTPSKEKMMEQSRKSKRF